MPANILANDILLLFVETANQAATLSTANGFVSVGAPTGTGTAAGTTATLLTVFWKRAVGGGADVAPVVADSGDHQAARIGLWRGAKTSGNPWNVAPVWTVDATSDTSGNPTGVTTTVAGCGIVVGASNTVDSNTGLTITASLASVPDLVATGMGDNTNSGGGGGLNVLFGTQTSAGATGTATLTYSTASQKSMVVIALEPVAVTAPGAPTIGAATAGNAQASVAFTAPASDGGSPILDYRITSTPGAITATGIASSPGTITGLTNSTSYTFTVAARNAVGYGPESAASNAVTPVAPVAALDGGKAFRFRKTDAETLNADFV